MRWQIWIRQTACHHSKKRQAQQKKSHKLKQNKKISNRNSLSMRRVLCVLSRILLRNALRLWWPSLSASTTHPCNVRHLCPLWLRWWAVVCAGCKLPPTASLITASAASLMVVILLRGTTVLCGTGGVGGCGATDRVSPGPENQGPGNTLPLGRRRWGGAGQQGLKGAISLFIQATVHPKPSRRRQRAERGCLGPEANSLWLCCDLAFREGTSAAPYMQIISIQAGAEEHGAISRPKASRSWPIGTSTASFAPLPKIGVGQIPLSAHLPFFSISSRWSKKRNGEARYRNVLEN